MPRGVPRHVKGERVRMSLIESRPNGLSTKHLADVSGLSLSQVRSGLAEVREESALANSEPLTWSRNAGYQLSESPTVWCDYEHGVTTSLHNRLIRFMKGTVLPHAQRLPEDPRIKFVVAQLNAAAASLQMVISDEQAVSRHQAEVEAVQQ